MHKKFVYVLIICFGFSLCSVQGMWMDRLVIKNFTEACKKYPTVATWCLLCDQYELETVIEELKKNTYVADEFHELHILPTKGRYCSVFEYLCMHHEGYYHMENMREIEQRTGSYKEILDLILQQKDMHAEVVFEEKCREEIFSFSPLYTVIFGKSRFLHGLSVRSLKSSLEVIKLFKKYGTKLNAIQGMWFKNTEKQTFCPLMENVQEYIDKHTSYDEDAKKIMCVIQQELKELGIK